jgi:hypothetical protein
MVVATGSTALSEIGRSTVGSQSKPPKVRAAVDNFG